MIKIAYITNNIAPFRIDLLDLVSEYADVTIYYYYDIEKGTNPKYVKKRPSKANLCCIKNINWIKRLKLIRKNDIIVIDGYGAINKIILFILLVLTNTKYIISVDGIIGTNIEKKVLKFVKKLVLSNASKVLSTGEETDNKLVELGAQKEKIIRHYFTTIRQNDIEPNNYNDKLQYKRDLKLDGKKTILYVGKFVTTKGIYELGKVANKLGNYNFIFIGGTIEQFLDVGNNLTDNIKIIEFLDKKEILEYMFAADLFVLPTYSDVWGLVVIEALSSGTPVVTTNKCNAGCEFVRDGINGYIIDIKDEIQLENKIISVLEEFDFEKVFNYNRKLMGNYHLEEAAENFYFSVKE
ncbi:glycosyltransferase family 4 protein [Metabacillus litoralis]|uniref:glycosyltransferase family 4 protein n=1 Tax=Metabacillus litoralis TaxID=152268 RepID=UPI00203C7A94|nr:glycosyltransferase family 4 protein [Metabacillus litoralis]MCM3163751.1 glycosyltransferase family 4 protein [Metabacillus litoralis]